MEQKEEVKKNGPLNLDFELLLPRHDHGDEEPPPSVVATTIVVDDDDDVEQKQREELRKMSDRELEEAIFKFNRTLKQLRGQLPDGGLRVRANMKRLLDEIDRRRLRQLAKEDDDDVEQKQREELRKMSDRELEEAIFKFNRVLKKLDGKLPDGGLKMRANIERFQDEIDRRRLRQLAKEDHGFEKLTELKGPQFTTASDGVRREASVPASQSLFIAHFSKKLDGKNTDSRTVNAFESEFSVLGRCDNGRERRPMGRRNPPRVKLSWPRPASTEMEAPPPVVTEPSPQPQLKRLRQEQGTDLPAGQEQGLEADSSGGRGSAGDVAGTSEQPVDVEAEQKKFEPEFTCADGYIITGLDSLRADPSIAAGLLQGFCLPKDMAGLAKNAGVCFDDAMFHMALAGQCMVNARGRILKLSDDLAEKKEKLKEERKLRKEAERSVEAFTARLAKVKAELQVAKEAAARVLELEAEMARMQKRHRREVRAADDKGYYDGFARAGQEYISQSRRDCNDTAAREYPKGYQAGYIQGWLDTMNVLAVPADSPLRATAPEPIVPTAVLPFTAEECASPPPLPALPEDEEEEQADGQ